MKNKPQPTRIKKPSIFISIVAAAVLVIAASFFVIYSEKKSTPASTAEAKAEAKAVSQEWLHLCTTEKCIQKGLEGITASKGPKIAMDGLDYYIHNDQSSLKGDNHLRSHFIGRQTVKTYGVKGQYFLDCSTRFDYGCMHGYLEQLLDDGMTPVAAAKEICGPIEASASYSSNMKYYCYHGLGHGIMTEADYALQPALDTCDSLGSQLAQSGCWQGVFMENVTGSMEGDLRNFSDSDPLTPCNTVADKYQRECYITLEGYLFKFYKWDVAQAAQACLGAGQHTQDCLEGVGLAASGDAWQKILLDSQLTNDSERNTWLICSKFPQGYTSGCVTGAVTQILEIDRFNLARADRFCSMAKADQAACYKRIGYYMKLESPSAQQAASYCSQLSKTWQEVCRQAG
jgi:hypothetical protein